MTGRPVLLALVVLAGCGDGGGPGGRVPAAVELAGTYDATIVEHGTSRTGVAKVFLALGDTQHVFLDFPLDALDELDARGELGPDGNLPLDGFRFQDDVGTAVSGTVSVRVTRGRLRIEGELQSALGPLGFTLERPIESAGVDPRGPFVLAFEPSPGGSGCPSAVRTSLETFASGDCAIAGGPEVPDRVGSTLFGGSCIIAPSGAFWARLRYRNGPSQSFDFGVTLDLLGTLHAGPDGVVGAGRFGLQRRPFAPGLVGAWTALPPACGDGHLDPGETCDDGNLTAGDGCDAICLSEGPTSCPPDDHCCVAHGA